MMTEMDDPMVLESVLAARAREMREAVLKYGVFENCVVDSPASGAMEVTEQVVGMVTSPPALTHSLVGDDMSNHGDGAQTESAQEEGLALPTKPSEGGIASELPFKSSPFSSANSGNFNDNAGEGTVVADKKRKKRGKNWAQKDTDDLLRSVLNTTKVCSRMEQGTASKSHWDARAEAVPGRTGHECRGRMDTLNRSYTAMKKYCDEHQKEFKQLNEMDFSEMKVSPRLTEDWYNQIRACPPRPKKKLKTKGAGGSSKSTGLVPDSSTLGLQPHVVLPDGIEQCEPALVWRLEYGVGIQRNEFVSPPCQGRSPSCDWNLNHTHYSSEIDFVKADIGITSDRKLHYIKLCHALCLTGEELGLLVVAELL